MGFFNQIFGSRPEVPELEKLDPKDIQKTAIANNLAALPEAENLVSKTNLFNREQIDQMLAAAGGQGLLQNSASQIDKMISGELPLSDQQQSWLGSVAKSFGSGTAGSGSMGNLVARDLGLRTLDVIGKGLNSAESWLRTTASLYEPSMLNVSSMFLTPAQQYQMENEQNIQQFQNKWMERQIGAMPDPVMAGINAEIMTLASSFLGGMGGSMGGGMGGMGGGGGGGGGMASNYTQDYSKVGTIQGGWGGNWASNYSNLG